MSVGLGILVLIAPNVCAYLDVSMDTAKLHLSANVKLDGLECFVINVRKFQISLDISYFDFDVFQPFAKKVVNMVIVANLENAYVIQDGLDPIVTNA